MRLAVIALLFALFAPLAPQTAYAETQAVEWCIGNGADEPVSFTYCTAEALTANEIQKCLQGDCFGENNTIRVLLDNARNDVEQGTVGSTSDLCWLNQTLGGSCYDNRPSRTSRITVTNASDHAISFHFNTDMTETSDRVFQPGESLTLTAPSHEGQWDLRAEDPTGVTQRTVWGGGVYRLISPPQFLDATPRYHPH